MNKSSNPLTICGMVAIAAMTTGCSNTPTKVEYDGWLKEFYAMTDSCLLYKDDARQLEYSDDLVGTMHTAIILNQGKERDVIELMFEYRPFRLLMFNDWDGYCGWSFLAGMSDEYYYSVMDIIFDVQQEWFNKTIINN